MLIDTHCHLSKDEYENLDEVIKGMDGIIIANGCDDKTNLEVLNLVKKYPNVYGALGIHPEEIESITDKSFEIIEKNICNSKIVAIGEIGLDYYWTKDNKVEQINLFKKQLDLAKKYNLPVIVHSREAIQDTYDILKKYNLKGTIHSFSSSLEMANKFIDLGYKIGVGGVVTFKNAKKLQEIVCKLNLSDILVETDSPYLTPEPYRGKRNCPSNVKFVVEKISQIKNISYKEALEIVNSNAIKQFDLKI